MRSMRPSSSAERRGLAVLLVALGMGALAPMACSPPCDSSDDANPPERYTGGLVSCDAGACVYESS